MEAIPKKFERRDPTFSIEVFPPKTDAGFQTLLQTIERMVALEPDFFSCTYGAGGGSRGKTFDIVQHIEQTHGITAMAHLTCVLNTKADISAILEDVYARGIKNILALRGDPPQDQPDWTPGENHFKYSSELTRFIRQFFGPDFGIGVAGFPEGHLLCPDRERDADFLKMKTDAGADFIITQLFFDNQDYFDYVKRLKARGVIKPILPGVLPITDYHALLRFTKLCGASIPQTVKDIFEPIADDKDAVLKAGIDFAVAQCQGLLAKGAPGIHFYALNKISPTSEILSAIR